MNPEIQSSSASTRKLIASILAQENASLSYHSPSQRHPSQRFDPSDSFQGIPSQQFPNYPSHYLIQGKGSDITNCSNQGKTFEYLTSLYKPSTSQSFRGNNLQKSITESLQHPTQGNARDADFLTQKYSSEENPFQMTILKTVSRNTPQTNGEHSSQAKAPQIHSSRNTPTESNASPSKVRRPVSFYENYSSPSEDRPSHAQLKRSRTFHSPTSRSPSQGSASLVTAMNTTVPLNLRACVNPERHVPTRSSLRHSRMIVLKRSCTVPHKYLPPIIRYHRVAKKLVILQLGLGLTLICTSTWLAMFSNTLYTRDTPYWSAIPLLLAGLFSFVLLFCCRKEYPGMRLNCYQFIYKIFTISLSLLTSVLCFSASLFAVFHLTFLFFSTCDDVDATCVCKSVDAVDNALAQALMKLNVRSFQYARPCSEVTQLTVLLLASCCLNGLAGGTLFYYVYLHWKSRYLYIYSHVDTVTTTPAVLTNK